LWRHLASAIQARNRDRHAETRVGVLGRLCARFVIDTLPPGEYWLIATSGLDDRIESGEWQTQALLASLVSRARRVTMGEGQQQTVDLRVVAMQ
jgi:hypothetical protein